MRKIKPGTIVKLTHGYYYENWDGPKRYLRMPGLWLVQTVSVDWITVIELHNGPRGEYIHGKQMIVMISGPTMRSKIVPSLVLRPYRVVVPRIPNKRKEKGHAKQ